ncbi:MAG: isopeptide-forming domain-containing fimbrial protein [Rivularia sp. (in: cyanobacteria)]
MTSLISWLRRKSLFLTISSLSVIAYGIIPTVAQTVINNRTINNTATGGADNLPGNEESEQPGTVESNTVTVNATQAALRLTKTGDRAAAEPGDTVIYRLQIKNNGESEATNLRITDRLPLGLRLVLSSVKANVGGNDRTEELSDPVINASNRGTSITINSTIDLQREETLVVTYAAEVTPDAIRGSGINLAQAITETGLPSNQSSHRLRIRQGILSDCGTLIGRVFVDKNFDGEQQPNEPGVPNAVVYMDDGNRIVTDANGLYSLANVISGYRSAALDLTSLPGYSLAPNKYFIETNSPSRLVKLSPGSMVRVNFAVTPAFSEGKQ